MIAQFLSNYPKLLGLIVLVAFTNCKQDKATNENDMTTNVLLQEWTGPLQWHPCFRPDESRRY